MTSGPDGLKYKRLLIKLSGEALMGRAAYGIDMSVVRPKGDWKIRQRLVHAGRLGHEKNVDVVVHAFAHLLEDRVP